MDERGEMKISSARRLNSCWQSLAILAVLFCFAPQLRANPVIIPGPAENVVLSAYAALALLLEAVCVVWLLRPFRRPRFLFLWIVGMHLVTFPVFLGVMAFLNVWLPDFAAGISEALAVVLEGGLIYLICRRAPSKSTLPRPSAGRCWFASLAGNATSALGFCLLLVPTTFLFR